MNWQRARTEEKKNERKAAICSAAFELFREHGYDAVSLNGIAAKAGFTKSNMYRYFTSREEIFLNIFTTLFEERAQDYCTRLEKLKTGIGVEPFAKAWVTVFLRKPEFLDMIPLLFISLEKTAHTISWPNLKDSRKKGCTI